MSAILIVFGLAVFALLSGKLKDEEASPVPLKLSDRLGGLWDIAHNGMRENRFLRAEKALLTILKIDQITILKILIIRYWLKHMEIHRKRFK